MRIIHVCCFKLLSLGKFIFQQKLIDIKLKRFFRMIGLITEILAFIWNHLIIFILFIYKFKNFDSFFIDFLNLNFMNIVEKGLFK